MTDKQSTDTWKEMLKDHYRNDANGCDLLGKLLESHELDQYFLDGLPIKRSEIRALREWIYFLRDEWVLTQSTIACILIKLAEKEDSDEA